MKDTDRIPEVKIQEIWAYLENILLQSGNTPESMPRMMRLYFARAIEKESASLRLTRSGIVSLEGLTRYGFCDDGVDFKEFKDGCYVRLDDVEHLASTTAASAVPADPIAYTSSIKINHIMSKAQFDNCLPKNRIAFDIPLYAAAPSAALSEKAEPQWLPIESAPKDGCTVILTDGAIVTAGSYINEPASVREVRDMEGRYIDQIENEGYEGWMDIEGGIQSTHWMPLPPPPATTKDQAASKGGDTNG